MSSNILLYADDFVSFTIFIRLDLQLGALLHPLWVVQHQLDAEVGEGCQIVDGVLRVTALGFIAHLLPGLLLAGHSGAVLDGQVVAVAAGHVVAQRFPADGHLSGLDVHNLQAPRAMHGFWGEGRKKVV